MNQTGAVIDDINYTIVALLLVTERNTKHTKFISKIKEKSHTYLRVHLLTFSHSRFSLMK